MLNPITTSPNQHLTTFISKEVRSGFIAKPEQEFKSRNVCVTGKITEYKGKSQIVITKASDSAVVTQLELGK